MNRGEATNIIRGDLDLSSMSRGLAAFAGMTRPA